MTDPSHRHDRNHDWETGADEYARALDTPYHRHRLTAIRALIPADLYAPGFRVFEFGCGVPELFPRFIASGTAVTGIDGSAAMVRLAKAYLTARGLDPGLVDHGGAEAMASLADGSLDAVMAVNVLAYLDKDEEGAFYREAHRALREGGHLIVSHSNELFDLFSLNRYTVEFFRRYLVRDPSQRARLAALLTASDQPRERTIYRVRENPLCYGDKLKRLGFEETARVFINPHPAPPPLVADHEPDEHWDPCTGQAWTAMFTCSMFATLARRVARGSPSDGMAPA